jgi:hypothetical protein
MPPSWWNTEGLTLTYRFDFFSVDAYRPFLKAISDRRGWICISRESLDNFVGKLSSNSAAQWRARTRGRPTGSGSYAQPDAKLVKKALQLIAKQPGLSAMQAARKFGKQISGNGTLESREKRLERRITAAQKGS